MPFEQLRSVQRSLRHAATEFEVHGTESTSKWFKRSAEEVVRF